MLRLNVGCGRSPLPDWINLDVRPLPGVDLVADLDGRGSAGPAAAPLPLPDGSVEEFLLSHVLEHIREPLPMMEELWRVAAPGARMTVRCPYGSSDDAWEDPTHVRAIFLQSFGYFSQPYYWRADYGYRGDWRTDRLILHLDSEVYARCQDGGPRPTPETLRAVRTERNVVRELVAHLSAVKPVREPLRELQEHPPIEVLDARW
jgi:hypothetical protein